MEVVIEPVSFALGIVFSCVVFFCMWRLHCLVKRYVYKKEWYQVVDVQPSAEPQIWNVVFLVSGYQYYGYCKKQPPEDVNPTELMVRIKHFNGRRISYHLHWEKIPKTAKERKALGL